MTTTATIMTTNVIPKAPISYDVNLPYKEITAEERQKMESATPYPQYLPAWDKIWVDPLPEENPALRADKTKRHLLTPNVTTSSVTPRMGTILNGVQLTQLSDAAKDELAFLVCERKVVVFLDQDFVNTSPEYQPNFMNYFDKPNYQPVSGTVKGYPGFHIIHRDGNKDEIQRFFQKKSTSTLWYQDVSYERQPPRYVLLGLLQGPEVGGDTVFVATDEAYKCLSLTFRSLLDNLKAVRSSAKMISHTRAAGGLVRKDPVEFIYPLIRVHPVTGEKCIFLNGDFITELEGMKETEWKVLLDFLLHHITTSHDFQARVSWKPRTVVM